MFRPSLDLRLLRHPVGALFVLLAAVFAVYAPSLGGQFLWDDNHLVKNNLLIRSPLFCLEVFRHTLFNDISNFYRPTQTLTFIVDYWFSGLNPFGYHLTSVLIHALNAVLLCWVLRLVLPTMLPSGTDKRRIDYLALGVALVWAVHPVHSAAVAYVSGTADTLAMACCLTAALLCERALRAGFPLPRALYGAGAFLGLLLGLCAKEIASVWLVLFLGYLFLGRADTSRRMRWTVVAFSVVALAIYLGLRHLPAPPQSPPPLPPNLPPKAVLMLRALGDYGSLLIFPKDLFMERQVFAAPGLANSQDEWFYHSLLFSGVVVLLAFGLGAWWPGRGRTLRRVGAVWFMVGFLPISNLFPLNASVAEHWLYLPSIGFLLFLAGVGLDALPPWLHGRRPTLALAVGLLVVGALGLRTWYRTFDWMDDLTFFRQTIADGGDVPRARASLAAAYGHRAVNDRQTGADEQAIAVLRDVVSQHPQAMASRVNLANSLARRGDLAEAKSILDVVAANLFARPPGGDADELVITIRSLDVLAKDDPAWPARRRDLLDRGLQQHPESWDLLRCVIQARERDGQPTEALALARRFADAHWWHGPAWIVVGQLEAGSGHPAVALSIWDRASRLDVHDAEAFSNAAALHLQEGHLDQARDFQARAVDRQPDSPRQHVLLAQVFARQGNTEAAQAQIAVANSLVEAEKNNR